MYSYDIGNVFADSKYEYSYSDEKGYLSFPHLMFSTFGEANCYYKLEMSCNGWEVHLYPSIYVNSSVS